MNEKTSFISSILLNEPLFDISELADLLEKDFKFKIERDKAFDTKTNTFACYIDNNIITVALMPAKIPNNEAQQAGDNNKNWKNASEIAQNHKAHVLIVASGDMNDAIDLGVLHVIICSCALKQKHATAIFTLGTLIEPEKYLMEAKNSIQNHRLPLLNLVHFGFYKENEETTSAYTYGLRNFARHEIEIVKSEKTLEEVFSYLTRIVNYILTEDKVINDGEIIGFSADEQLKITLSKGVAVDVLSLKITL